MCRSHNLVCHLFEIDSQSSYLGCLFDFICRSLGQFNWATSSTCISCNRSNAEIWFSYMHVNTLIWRVSGCPDAHIQQTTNSGSNCWSNADSSTLILIQILIHWSICGICCQGLKNVSTPNQFQDFTVFESWYHSHSQWYEHDFWYNSVVTKYWWLQMSLCSLGSNLQEVRDTTSLEMLLFNL